MLPHAEHQRVIRDGGTRVLLVATEAIVGPARDGAAAELLWAREGAHRAGEHQAVSPGPQALRRRRADQHAADRR